MIADHFEKTHATNLSPLFIKVIPFNLTLCQKQNRQKYKQ